MPEGPVVKTWAHRLRAKRTPREVQGRFILYPRCFKRANDYETCTVEREADYEPASDCPVDVRDEHTFPSEIDRFRSKDQSWEYLLDSHLPGPLHIGVRGSILAVAAGHHLWLVDFMTDGNVMSVSTADYRAIAARSQDVPGTGGEDDDTEQPRSFAIPDQYKDPQSAHPEALRRLNIFFAFECSDDTVWLFVDHTRLIRFHVVSRGVPWTAADLNPDSQIWTYAWAHSYGPDWFAADDDVLLPLLDQWRDNLIVDVTLGHYSTVPIADAIADDTVYFNGFGEHTATDLLHEAGILPHMPLWVVATDNYIFGQLRQRITVYSAAFKDPHFVKACGQGSSDPNPFFFNEHADNNYITQYVRVYQREVTCLSGFLYNVLAAQGLFDTEHTIWSPYLHQASNFTDKKKRMVPVWVYWRNGTDIPSQRRYYTIIQAHPPPEWGLDDWYMAKVSDHALLGGVQRSLGPMQFPQYILNMISIENLLGKGTMGRRPKKVSGKRGRPQKAKTVKQKKALAKRRISDINSETSISMDLSSDMDADEPSIDAQGSSPSGMGS